MIKYCTIEVIGTIWVVAHVVPALIKRKQLALTDAGSCRKTLGNNGL